MNRYSVFVVACMILSASFASQAAGQSYKAAPFALPQELPAAQEDQAPAFAPRWAPFGVTSNVATSQIPLPVPFDPGDLLMQEAFNRSDFGAGYAVGAVEDPVAVFRLVPNVNLNALYDTGVPGSNHSPSSLALSGSPEARRGGVFSMNDTRASLKTDVQFPTITSQVYMELRVDPDDSLRFRQIYGRAGNWLGGSYFSSFSDNGTLPQSIIPDSAPAGAIATPDVVQLQYVRLYQSGFLWGAAIENPNSGDFTLVDPNDARLQRYPDFVARIRYQPLDAWGSLQGALLLRQFGYEDVNGFEHFSSAVSYSANARLKTYGDNNIRLGIVGGEGAGSRIFGLNADEVAAGPLNGGVTPLRNTGAFASYQHFWNDCLWSNAAYGYASANVTPGMPEETRIGQNGWVNLIWNNPSANVALGIEYQFAQREVGNGQHGMNHAVQFSLQIGKGYVAPDAAAPAAASGNAAVASDFAPGPAVSPGDRGVFPRL